MTTRNKFLKASITTKPASFLLILSLLLAAVPAIVSADQQGDGTQVITENLEFSIPEIRQADNNYITLEIDGTTDIFMDTGKPKLPELAKAIEIPFGSTDIQIAFNPGPATTMEVEGIIQPGPVSATLDEREHPILRKLISAYAKMVDEHKEDQSIITDGFDETLYSSDIQYGEQFEYDIFVGRNKDGELATFVLVRVLPAILGSVSEGIVNYITSADLTITYTPPQHQSLVGESYDLMILAPSGYVNHLAPLVAHKENVGFSTKLVNLDDIYAETYFELTEEERENFNRDDQETIKYFIYNAVKEWNVQYVMAVGGWRTLLGFNIPKFQFPIRYSHVVDGEPGYHAEQYYSCIMAYDEQAEEIVFDTWDSNGNGRFAEWDFNGWDQYDPFPDLYWGRLACRNVKEVKTMIDKIITYETETYGSDWFNSMLSVTGDGFQDLGFRTPLTVYWDFTGLPDGQYTIVAKSRLRGFMTQWGPADYVNFTVDRAAESRITFEETDHLKIEPLTEEQETLYPGKPVAEIVVPSEDDIVGNTDVDYVPPQAYIGENWAFVDYDATAERLAIQTKSYDPSPHDPWNPPNGGSFTEIQITIKDADGQIINTFTKESDCWWEGEIEGEQAVIFANGGTFNGPKIENGPFPTDRIWTSNGKWFTMNDVLDAYSQGYGLAYINGHSSCISFGDHYPGVPGGRDDGQVSGLAAINLRYGLERYQAEEGDPLFPLDTLTNGYELPVLLYSGCHSGQIDTSLVSLLYDPYNVLFGDRYATWTPEGVAWWITRLPQGGSIATIGNGGLGSGYIGDSILQGLTGWLFPRFFYNYNGQDGPHMDIVGQAYTQTLIDYSIKDDVINDITVRKHFEQWDLLGDPTLKIGGYDPDDLQGTSSLGGEKISMALPEPIEAPIDDDKLIIINQALEDPQDYLITHNAGADESPKGILVDGEDFLTGYTYHPPEGTDIHPGFAMSSGGGFWNEIIYANSVNSGETSLTSWKYEDSDGEEQTAYVGSIPFGASNFGSVNINDITNPYSWSTTQYFFPSGVIHSLGLTGMAVTGYGEPGQGKFGGVWDCVWDGSDAVLYMFSEDASVYGYMEQAEHFSGDVDESTGIHYWVYELSDSTDGRVFAATPPATYNDQMISSFSNPDVAADGGWAFIVSDHNGVVSCRRSNNGGGSWTPSTVTNDGSNAEIVINTDGTLTCYFVRGNNIYKAISEDHGVTWNEEGQVSSTTVDASQESPFAAVEEAIVFAKNDGDLYTIVNIETLGAYIAPLELDNGVITTTITASGTRMLTYFEWQIDITGDSPLGQFFGGTPLLMALFRGRVFSGAQTSEEVIRLRSGESMDISASSFFGLGHVQVTAKVIKDGETLSERSEDGFLLGGRILLKYPEE